MLYLQKGSSLVAGDDGPENLKTHNLDSTALPTLEEMSEAHHGAASIFEIEWGNMGMKALQPTFKLKGWDPQVLGLLGQRKRKVWTIYGNVIDKVQDEEIEVVAIIKARLAKVAPDSFERGKLMGHDHAMHEVVGYKLFFNKEEKIWWDHFAHIWRVDGVDQLADERRILRLPG